MRPTDSFNRIPRVPSSETNVPSADKLRLKKEEEKRERATRDQLDIYLGWWTRSLLIRWINFFPSARKGHFAAGNWSLGRRTLDQTCASRIPAFWLPPLLPPPIVPNDSSPLEGSAGVNYFAALERLGRFCCNNESNYKINQNRLFLMT